MTASRLGLAILTAIAVALAALHVLAGDRGGVESRAAFADVDPAAVTEIRWDRPGAPAIALVHDGGTWRMAAPSPGPVDAGVVTDLLDALRLSRWQRRATASPGPPRFTLTVGTRRLAIGPDVPGVGSWISEGDRHLLVEPWVIAALDREPLALRLGSPVSTPPSRITGLEIHGATLDLVLAGAPLAITGDGRIRLRPDVTAALTENLAALHVESLVDDPRTATTVAFDPRVLGGVAAEEVVLRGACPARSDAVWIGGTAGEVCVDGGAFGAFAAAAHVIAATPLEVADPRPVAETITDLVLGSGIHLHWRGAAVEVTGADGTIHAADDDAVARVVAALTEPATPILLATPRPPSRSTISITTAAGIETLDAIGDDVVAEPTSPVGLRLGGDAIMALRLGVDDLRDHVLWHAEPSMFTQVSFGARTPTSTTLGPDDAWARAVGDALAAPRAVRFLTTAGPIRAVLEVTYAPPPAAGAAPEVHRIELGRAFSDGCAAVADGNPVVLPRDVCTAIDPRLKR